MEEKDTKEFVVDDSNQIDPSQIEVELVDDEAANKPHKLKKENKKLVKENEDLTKKVEELTAKVEELDREVATTKNAYYKAYADADNLKKRYTAENEKANKYRIQSFALEILPAIDALELALLNNESDDGFVKGVKLTYDKIMHALELEGVTAIEVMDKEFDANVAHAIMTEKVDGVEPNKVIAVFQKGYMLKDRLLRAALVKVSE